MEHSIPASLPPGFNSMIRSRRLTVILIFISLSVLATLYTLCDPAKSDWMPKCIFHLTTGYDCPGCGSQRAMHALMTGDFAGAFRANSFLFLLAPFILLLAIAEFSPNRYPRLYRFVTSSVVIYSLLGLIVAWTIFRNIFLR